ncbi:MAG: GDP-L-fucose synthase [Bacteroidia bacterium]|nr:GDP-L-fucose synthase [Bacteroidia bacterium]
MSNLSDKNARIFVAGGRGMVGSAIVRALRAKGYTNVLAPSSAELDLTSQQQTQEWFGQHRPEYVFMAAAKVGGILANNTYRADFLYLNLMIEANVIHASHIYGVKKMLFLGSSCIYPKLAPQPLKEEYLLTGELEYTNEPYAIAKIAGIKLVESYRKQYGSDFISAMPTNLYGPNDNYDLSNSHVLPALIRKFHEAKISNAPSVTIWGSGSPLREFLHVDDLAQACLFLMEVYNGEDWLNIGVGEDISIKDLALLVKEISGFEGELVFDTSKPDGTPRKLMDVSKIHALSWKASIPLRDGIAAVYKEYAQAHTALS